MITQQMIDRINELARKQRSEQGLTENEREEQAALRREYIESYKASLRGQLDHTVLLRPDGTKERLSDRKKKP